MALLSNPLVVLVVESAFSVGGVAGWRLPGRHRWRLPVAGWRWMASAVGGGLAGTGFRCRWRGGVGRLPRSVAGWRWWTSAAGGGECDGTFQMKHFLRKCFIWKDCRHIPRHQQRKSTTATPPPTSEACHRHPATDSGSLSPPPRHRQRKPTIATLSPEAATCGGPEAATPPPIPQKTHSKRWLERKYLSTPTGLYYCLRRFGFDFINR